MPVANLRFPLSKTKAWLRVIPAPRQIIFISLFGKEYSLNIDKNPKIYIFRQPEPDRLGTYWTIPGIRLYTECISDRYKHGGLHGKTALEREPHLYLAELLPIL
ncbi:MAG: hypothetical protein VR65_01845 [Desulfobulbaceae bacterium BRH_c16a]|nr:MAG: hypothetical protein VR65_01845 [Desulfobulbaceae bacterium BRH_c16a]